MPVANARMYSVTPGVKAAWKELLSWVLARARLPWAVIDHDAPLPMAQLWERDDLGLAMMCGLPYSQRQPRPTLVAAPVPSPQRYRGQPVYFTDIAVRADAPYRSLEDTFGKVIGYTLHDSMSGYAALRRHLLPLRGPQPLYAKAIGGLQSARSVIEALADGRIDVGPLDSYSHDLLRAHDAQFAAQVRIVETTQPAPIPPLVATTSIKDDELQRLRAALLDVGGAVELATLRKTLLLRGFAVPEEKTYAVFDRIIAQAAEHAEVW
jgi:ABC-type phosphate/phosphonate transport system substrate-binding protein